MPGIFMTRGSRFTIPSFTIDLDNLESMSITPLIGFDIYPLWLQSAISQARACEVAAKTMDEKWDQVSGTDQSALVEDELVAAMGAIVASAAAIDAFYGSIRDRCKIAEGSRIARRNRSRGRERIIAATFQQRFALKNDQTKNIQATLRDVLRFRHLALHSHGRSEPPVVHPRLDVGMSQHHVIFRAENAVKSAAFALTIISYLMGRPHERYRELREHSKYAKEWLAPLVRDWESDHEPIGLPKGYLDVVGLETIEKERLR